MSTNWLSKSQQRSGFDNENQRLSVRRVAWIYLLSWCLITLFLLIFQVNLITYRHFQSIIVPGLDAGHVFNTLITPLIGAGFAATVVQLFGLVVIWMRLKVGSNFYLCIALGTLPASWGLLSWGVLSLLVNAMPCPCEMIGVFFRLILGSMAVGCLLAGLLFWSVVIFRAD